MTQQTTNPYVLIQSLYTILGKMTVKLEAHMELNTQNKAHIEALKKKLKELRDDSIRPDSQSD